MNLGALRTNSAESQGYYADRITSEQTQKARAAYFACVDQLDEVLGDFLTLLDRDGLLDNTVIIYTSDHGELAGEHGIVVEAHVSRGFDACAVDYFAA